VDPAVRVIGVLGVANSNGIVLSSIIEPEVIEKNPDTSLTIARARGQFYALGNLVLANDRAAVISPIVDKRTSSLIEETLGVEIAWKRIAGSDLVGSLACVSNYGILVSPFATDEEVEDLKEFFKVDRGDIGTVNLGQPFIAAGILANTKGCVAGEDTTGLEMMRIAETLVRE